MLEMEKSSDPSRHTENASVLLRRQIPPDFANPSRSWIGGLPELPEDVDWPRKNLSDQNERRDCPLHFVAQLCCADLPDHIWEGECPSDGSLAFFLDANAGQPEPSDYRVIHVTGNVYERPLPHGMLQNIDDAPDRFYEIPSTPEKWHRWPVNFVITSKRSRRNIVDNEGRAIPIYPDDPINAYRDFPDITPFTRSSMRLALESITDSLQDVRRYNAHPDTSLANVTPQLLETEQARLRDVIASFAEHDDPEIQRLRAERLKTLVLLEANFSVKALCDHIESASEHYDVWKAEALESLAEYIDALPNDDVPLPEGTWNMMADLFQDDAFENLRLLGGAGRPHFAATRISVLDRFFPRDWRLLNILLRYYLDPALNALIPGELRAGFEKWAGYYLERPHRINGDRDRVHSAGLTEENADLLLLQLSSDAAMGWCWGYIGTHYFTISRDALRKRKFDAAIGWMESR